MDPIERDPRQVFQRYGRQLLVEGVRFDRQADLHRLAVVAAHDASPVGQAAAEVALRYLIGAGVGRTAVPSALAPSLQALDPALHLLAGPGDATPPAAHLWLARRDYGASLDIALTEADPAVWAQGQSGPARVATLRLELGRPAEPGDAVVLGAWAAELVIEDALGIEPLPAIVVVDLRDPEQPSVTRTPRPADQGTTAHAHHPPALLHELRAAADQLEPILADCEANYPREACGLLLRDPAGKLLAVVAPNQQDRYHALDPAAYPRTARTAYKLNERLIAKAADRGETLVGIWHSHCDAGAYFSAEDVRCAAPDDQPLYPGVAYLVVSVLGGKVRGMQMYHWDPATKAFAAERTDGAT